MRCLVRRADPGAAALWMATIALAVVSLPSSVWAGEPGADKIVENALEKNSLEFDAGRAEMSLVVEGRNGDKSDRSMVVKSAKIDGAVRTLIELTAPEELKGQAFLFAENDEGDDDVWMYVPAFEVTRRIEGSKKQGAFLGSHFTYNDLESRDVQQASYEKHDDSEIGDTEDLVVDAHPKSESDSEYGKVLVYVRKEDYVPLKFKFFEDSDELMKTLFVEKLDETDSGRTYIKQMQMRSQKGGFTRITLESLDTEADFPDAMFSKDQLGK